MEAQAQLDAVPEPVTTENGKIPDDVELARGEVVDDVKIADWHGLALTLPPKLPASFMFEMTEAEVKGDDSSGGSYAVHTVYKLLGPEQWKRAKDHAEELGLSVEDFGDFITVIYRAYGMGGSGEQSASSGGSESDGG